jgi:integrase
MRGLFSSLPNYSPIAQSVERRTVNPQVPGSSPGRGAKHGREINELPSLDFSRATPPVPFVQSCPNGRGESAVASVRCRGPHKYQARVIRKGYPPLAKTFDTRKAACTWADLTEQQIADGTLSEGPQRGRLTLAEALVKYAAEITPAKRGAVSEMGRIRLWQKHDLSYRFIDTIRGVDLAQHRDARLAAGKGGNTVRLELALISHLFEVARREWGYESLTNPVKALRKPKLPKGRTRRLNEGEEAALLTACSAGPPWLTPLVVLAIETAMRRSELVALTWDNVNLQSCTALLPITKNGESRVIPLSKRATAVLRSLPVVHGHRVFNVGADRVTYVFLVACRNAGIAGLRLHDLRHEATSRLFEKHLTLPEVASITGHKTWQMLRRYTHLRVEALVAKLG